MINTFRCDECERPPTPQGASLARAWRMVWTAPFYLIFHAALLTACFMALVLGGQEAARKLYHYDNNI